uniref:Tropomyosin alpha-3 chain-like n=1 Tax=Callorhinchus milii TaxID=7868 RepID=A0A4W3GEL2_CALMI|eukprot:gi/632989125/ref/XP_007883481.1/ PREDICTED: tropomyosin alpha-3 chain-like [Callorhinchus milii]
MSERSSEERERSFTEATLPHYVKAVSAVLDFTSLAARLGEREPDQGEVQTLTRQADTAHKEVLLAESAASGLVDGLDAECEALTVRYSKLSSERRGLEGSLASLQGELQVLTRQQDLLTSQLDTERTSLRQAQDCLREAQAKKGEKRTGRDVGIGLSFLLPCVGIPMAMAFEKERQFRKAEVDMVTGDHCQLKGSVTLAEEKLSELSEKLPVVSVRLEEARAGLEEAREKEQRVKERRTGLAQVQTRLRGCTHYLSSLCGQAKALQAQSQHLYSLSPLLPFLEELVAQITEPPGGASLVCEEPPARRLASQLASLLPTIHQLRLRGEDPDYLK